jgi:hypothetical protein
MAQHGQRLPLLLLHRHHASSPGLNAVGFLGLRILDLLRGWVEVLGAVGLSTTLLAGWAVVVLEVLVVDGEGLVDLLTESLVVGGAVSCQ